MHRNSTLMPKPKSAATSTNAVFTLRDSDDNDDDDDILEKERQEAARKRAAERDAAQAAAEAQRRAATLVRPGRPDQRPSLGPNLTVAGGPVASSGTVISRAPKAKTPPPPAHQPLEPLTYIDYETSMHDRHARESLARAAASKKSRRVDSAHVDLDVDDDMQLAMAISASLAPKDAPPPPALELDLKTGTFKYPMAPASARKGTNGKRNGDMMLGETSVQPVEVAKSSAQSRALDQLFAMEEDPLPPSTIKGASKDRPLWRTASPSPSRASWTSSRPAAAIDLLSSSDDDGADGEMDQITTRTSFGGDYGERWDDYLPPPSPISSTRPAPPPVARAHAADSTTPLPPPTALARPPPASSSSDSQDINRLKSKFIDTSPLWLLFSHSFQDPDRLAETRATLEKRLSSVWDEALDLLDLVPPSMRPAAPPVPSQHQHSPILPPSSCARVPPPHPPGPAPNPNPSSENVDRPESSLPGRPHPVAIHQFPSPHPQSAPPSLPAHLMPTPDPTLFTFSPPLTHTATAHSLGDPSTSVLIPPSPQHPPLESDIADSGQTTRGQGIWDQRRAH
ncbi:hypothetical protein BCR44DRAFT_1426437 [Catenaria anguillulae PL171]|uniref:Uncharacterized protein n=1 Tax=Catenaria anguillulae PL171 TaxID=765915 RepID=A0A1Y2HXQ8_9FUNG|nr:hypothetical protein BCR44DRAFT_1426437 [Catenaria anguillulae PL171]